MITVETYIHLPGTFQSDEDALQQIAAEYGRTDWQAICNVVSLTPGGALVDVDESLGEMYFDPELQTFLFEVGTMEEVEEAVWAPSEDGPLTHKNGETGDYELVQSLEIVTHKRAASFLKEETNA